MTASSEPFCLSYHNCRNISSPDDIDVNRRVYAGSAPLRAVLGLDDNENVREYLVDAAGKQRRSPTLVHQAIRKTLRESPESFSVLNGGTVIVASSAEVDDKNKVLKLQNPSIINGSQTRGEAAKYFKTRSEDDNSEPSIKFEVIVTDDENLIAEISISRNFQNDVKPISIAGRLGQLDDLEASLQKRFGDVKLRKKESDFASDETFLDTEKVIQATFALMPANLERPSGITIDLDNKVFAYSQKTRCLKTFQRIAEHEDSRMYSSFIDLAPIAWKLYQKWKTNQGFIGTGIRSIEREKGKVTDVPDGIVFPIIAAHSVFVKESPLGMTLDVPSIMQDDRLIHTAKRAYAEIAGHNPQTMGKSKACYSALSEITSIFADLTATT